MNQIPERPLVYLFISITSQLTVHMSRQHCWFDMLHLPKSRLAGKPGVYLLSPFPFHTVTPLFLYLCSVPWGNQVLGSGLQSAFRPCLFFVFFAFLCLLLCLSSLAEEKKKDEGKISSWKQKVGYKRQKGKDIVKGHREGNSAAGYHGYWKAAD